MGVRDEQGRVPEAAPSAVPEAGCGSFALCSLLAQCARLPTPAVSALLPLTSSPRGQCLEANCASQSVGNRTVVGLSWAVTDTHRGALLLLGLRLRVVERGLHLCAVCWAFS